VSPEVIKTFYAAVEKAAQDPKVQQALVTGGLEIEVLNPEQFGKILASEYERWGETVRQAGIKAQ
jgi:tripartite-type tricarboxylate transporter receptor subunit TctC